MADTIYCRKSSFTDTDWEKIYEVAFRPDQRTPLSQLHDGLKTGQLLLHRSSGGEGLLCFSVTNILPTVALLAYLATDPNKRSSGIGSKHMKALIAEIRQDHPQLLGMFAEIESTREKGISEEERKHRKRRLAFYHRLGFKRYNAKYTIPSYDPGIPDEEGDLIWLDFNTGTLTCDAVAGIVKEIYVKAYLLNETDTRVVNVPVITGDVAACELPEDVTATVSNDAAAAPSTAGATVADAAVLPAVVSDVTTVIDVSVTTKVTEPASSDKSPNATVAEPATTNINSTDASVTEPVTASPAAADTKVTDAPVAPAPTSAPATNEEKKN